MNKIYNMNTVENNCKTTTTFANCPHGEKYHNQGILMVVIYIWDGCIQHGEQYQNPRYINKHVRFQGYIKEGAFQVVMAAWQEILFQVVALQISFPCEERKSKIK